MAFFMPAIMMFTVAILCFVFLKEHPRDVGLEGYEDDSRSLTTKMISDEGEDNVTTEVDATIGDVKSTKRSMSICEGLWIGIRIPGVLEFSLCLMFAKCVAYTFIYWTPYYLAHNGFTTSEASYLCTFVDVGGIFGGILAGFLSDRYKLYVTFLFNTLFSSLTHRTTLQVLSLIHIPSPRDRTRSRMPSSA